jgi:TonB-dependent receptor
MDRLIIIFIAIGVLHLGMLHAGTVKGRVIDAATHETLPGTTVYIIKEKKYAVTDGQGNYIISGLPVGNYILQTKGIGYEDSYYQPIIISKEDETITYDFYLKAKSTAIDEVQVTGNANKSTDLSARLTEQVASNVMNVVSAKSIELSPDLNVANVVQRMSGITLDKSTTGVGQYALLRGMDKRYSYTLVNGIKIPSTNNEHRYVPLDIFPSDLVDRIEVTKALTPDMEGDAMAGAINLVMKNAPDKPLLNANVSVGYNQFWNDHTPESFNTNSINFKSPYELYSPKYVAKPSDFPHANLDPQTVSVPLNTSAGFAIGNRFFGNKLGIVLAGSYQESHKGTQSLFFGTNIDQTVHRGMPLLGDKDDRTYSSNVQNYGLHNKIDFAFNNKHRLQLYTAYMQFAETQVRQTTSLAFGTNYDINDSTFNKSYDTRLMYNMQNLLNTTLQGDHKLSEQFSVQWSAVYSLATNRTPDMSTINTTQEKDNEGNINILQPIYVDPLNGLQELWRHNSDMDKSGYLNLKYSPEIFGVKIDFSAGGLYRQKTRSSFYNSYTIRPFYPEKGRDSSSWAAYGIDWTKFSNIKWGQVTQPTGNVAVGETFDAMENSGAGYGMFGFSTNKLQVKGGVRVEKTLQGYTMLYRIANTPQKMDTTYLDFLPSLHLKYSPVEDQNIRLSYYRATNKPGFLEIVPCEVIGEYFTTKGNAHLKHAIADNFDLRWEYFLAELDQVMVGFFYKDIKGAIENEFVATNSTNRNYDLTPENIPRAINYGMEIDFVKYIGDFGVKANYTYTSSNITTTKQAHFSNILKHDSTGYITEKRPLYGQSANMGNLSLLYRNEKIGINGQLSLTYTGDRIYAVSPFAYNDQWEKGFWQMDASAEKSFIKGWSVFIKAHNLLNTRVIVFIKAVDALNNDKPDHSASDKTTLVRNDYSEPSYLLGFRYKF